MVNLIWQQLSLILIITTGHGVQLTQCGNWIRAARWKKSARATIHTAHHCYFIHSHLLNGPPKNRTIALAIVVVVVKGRHLHLTGSNWHRIYDSRSSFVMTSLIYISHWSKSLHMIEWQNNRTYHPLILVWYNMTASWCINVTMSVPTTATNAEEVMALL